MKAYQKRRRLFYFNQVKIKCKTIESSKSYKILAIEQEMPSSNLTPMQHLLMQDKERHELLQELESRFGIFKICSQTSKEKEKTDS